jgi:hypothetical protein
MLVLVDIFSRRSLGEGKENMMIIKRRVGVKLYVFALLACLLFVSARGKTLFESNDSLALDA